MRKPHGATPHGIQYFTGSLPMLLVETCSKIQIEINGEATVLEIGDEYMGGTVKDILRKAHKESTGWELLLDDDESVEVQDQRVIAFSRRRVDESPVLSEDLEECPNWDGDSSE